jgi:hypothetical protein
MKVKSSKKPSVHNYYIMLYNVIINHCFLLTFFLYSLINFKIYTINVVWKSYVSFYLILCLLFDLIQCLKIYCMMCICMAMYDYMIVCFVDLLINGVPHLWTWSIKKKKKKKKKKCCIHRCSARWLVTTPGPINAPNTCGCTLQRQAHISCDADEIVT